MLASVTATSQLNPINPTMQSMTSLIRLHEIAPLGISLWRIYKISTGLWLNTTLVAIRTNRGHYINFYITDSEKLDLGNLDSQVTSNDYMVCSAENRTITLQIRSQGKPPC